MDQEQPITNNISQSEADFQPTEIKAGSRTVLVNSSLEWKVWTALQQCYDPEIPVNIVDLGLIYDVRVADEIAEEVNVSVTMTLTAPGCAMGPLIASDVRRQVMLVSGVRNVKVDLVFDPTWNPSMMSEAAKLTLNFG